MHPIICTFGSINIYSYGLMLVLAFLAATFLVGKQARLKGINEEKIFNFAFIGFIFGVLGARLFYVLENFVFYFKNPLEIIMLQRGGLAWFGGLILGTCAGIAYLKKNKMPVLATLDLIMPFVALAQAIGRIGCLLNGCCFGRVPYTGGIYFPSQNEFLIPTQIYSSLGLLAIYLILRRMQFKPQPQGKIFYMYLFLYSIKRFTIEFFRDDNPRILFNLTLFQVLSSMIFASSVIMLLRIRLSKPKP